MLNSVDFQSAPAACNTDSVEPSVDVPTFEVVQNHTPPVVDRTSRAAFPPGAFTGTPTALRVNGRTVPIRRFVAPESRPNGALGGRLSFSAQLPFMEDGVYDAEVRVNATWIPIQLNVSSVH